MSSLPKLLESPKVRRLIGLSLTLQGIVGFLAPEKMAKLNAHLWLREAFDNPGDLEPSDAYADLVRDASLAAVVFGVLTLRRAAQDEATASAERLLAEAESDEEETPVEIDPAEAEDDD